ncbi:hypothetical protein ACWEVP_40020 [Amycolatopsis sp. NPDC003865]
MLTIIRRSGLGRMADIDHAVWPLLVGLFPMVIIGAVFLGNVFAVREIVIYSPAINGSKAGIRGPRVSFRGVLCANAPRHAGSPCSRSSSHW